MTPLAPLTPRQFIQSKSSTPLAIVKPELQQSLRLPRTSKMVVFGCEDACLGFITDWFQSQDWAANPYLIFDLETKGTDASRSDAEVVGIACSSEKGTWYSPWSPGVRRAVLEACATLPIQLVAHNLTFDASFLYREASRLGLNLPKLGFCTFAIYKQLAAEGWMQQTWGLKDAQVQLLGWEEKGDVELAQWLIDEGYTKGVKVEKPDGPGFLFCQKTSRWCKPDKSQMWRAPHEILGKYCALDAESTWLLFNLLMKYAKEFPFFVEYHHNYTMSLIHHVVHQQLTGVRLDVERLEVHKLALEKRAREVEAEFFSNEEVAPKVAEYNSKFVTEHLSKEPPKVLKTGKPSVRWEKWNEAMEDIKKTNHFNLASGKQKQWLFYEALGYPVLVLTDNEFNPQPAVDESALKGFGAPGKLLIEHQELTKEIQFCEAYLEARQGDTIHYRLKVPGTTTGRLSGGGG